MKIKSKKGISVMGFYLVAYGLSCVVLGMMIGTCIQFSKINK